MDISKSHPLPLSTGTPVMDRSSLSNLPVEVFMRVVDYLTTAKDIVSLSQACKKLNGTSKVHAWRRFVLMNFPTLTCVLQYQQMKHQKNGVQTVETAADSSRPNEFVGLQWEHLAKALTSQSRAWDRRAFSISRIAPLYDFRFDIEIAAPPSDLSRFTRYDPETQTHTAFVLGVATSPQRSDFQTTDYHPVIDARVEFASCLHNKKEIVAWSTGAKLFVRVRRSGSFCPSENEYIDPKNLINDAYNNITNAASIIHEEYREGFDDVVTLNIVSPTLGIRGDQEGFVVDAIVGRASGYLNRISVNILTSTIDMELNDGHYYEHASIVVNTFLPARTCGSRSQRRITSTDVFGEHASCLACTSDGVLSLYQTKSQTHDIEPLDEVAIESESKNRSRAVKFLSHERLVVGIEGHHKALRTYHMTPSGLSLTNKLSTALHAEVDLANAKNSIYALEPVPTTSRPGGSLNGDVFLSGWYDGVVRLYDLRASHAPVASFGDSNDCAVYSLATYGQERFIAGTARSKLQIYDFRTGSKIYSYTSAVPCSSNTEDGLKMAPKDNLELSKFNTNESQLWLPRFPTRLHNIKNVAKLGGPLGSLQTSCANIISKKKSHLNDLQPGSNQGQASPSLEAFQRQEGLERTRWRLASGQLQESQASHATWERCHFDTRDGANRQCTFHKEAEFNHDTNLFLYGLHHNPRQRVRDRGRRVRERVISPIFSIASPSPLSPSLYIGAMGTVYEMAVGEVGAQGQTTDPYFNDAPYTVQDNILTDLGMYEARGNGALVSYRQSFEKHEAERSLMNIRNVEGRLDRSWLKL